MRISRNPLSVSFIVSTIHRGEQMIPILKALKVDAAVFGNHDFGMFAIMVATVAKIKI